MGGTARATRWQLRLFTEPTGDGGGQVPEAITAELVALLAQLLLDAASEHVGGDDESEDHA